MNYEDFKTKYTAALERLLATPLGLTQSGIDAANACARLADSNPLHLARFEEDEVISCYR